MTKIYVLEPIIWADRDPTKPNHEFPDEGWYEVPDWLAKKMIARGAASAEKPKKGRASSSSSGAGAAGGQKKDAGGAGGDGDGDKKPGE